MPIGFCTSMWMMKNQILLPSAFQKLCRPARIAEQGLEIAEADEAADLIVRRVNSDSCSVSASGTIMIAV